MKRSNKKLLIQSMIQFEIFLFFMLCINLTNDIMLKTFITFKFSTIIIRFIFCFHTMWICSMKNFKVVLINQFFDISWTCWIIIDAFSLFTKSSCLCWILKFFQWCLITRSIDTFSKSCNLFYRFFSMWWCWFF